MKVVVLDSKRRRIKVRPSSEEDLWTIMTIVKPGDYVEGRTLRDVAVKGGARKERRPIWIKLRVKAVEFQPFTGRLRFHGVIVEGPEEYGLKGKHHSMTLAPGQEAVLEREEGWPSWALDKLRASGPRGRAVVAAVDYDEYAVAVVAPHGFRVVLESASHLPGKDSPGRDEALEAYTAKVARAIAETASREGVGVVVIVGPGPLKNDVAFRVREMMPSVRVVVDDASMGGRAGVEEALRRQSVASALSQYSVVEAEQIIEEAMRTLAKSPELVAFTPRDALEAAEMGALKEVALIYDMLYDLDDEVRETIWRLLDAAERTRARIVLVPASSPAGEKIKRLGGVVAILRYPIR